MRIAKTRSKKFHFMYVITITKKFLKYPLLV